jgi:flavin-binding protein dodecin
MVSNTPRLREVSYKPAAARLLLPHTSLMAEHVYTIHEFVGSSSSGQDEAIRNAIKRAAETLPRLRWFEVTETRGQIVEGKIAHWQVTIRVGSTLEPA